MKNNKIYVENKHLVLVLDIGYQVIDVCTVKNAMKLIAKGRAETVEHDVEPMYSGVKKTNGQRNVHERPTIIRVINSIKYFTKQVSVTRTHVFKRDGHRCAYCSNVFDTKHLTVDHVIPKSRNGGYTWDNLVTSCRRCNSKKDDRTPEEAGMRLAFKPYRPSFSQFLKYMNGEVRRGWELYLYDSKKEKALA